MKRGSPFPKISLQEREERLTQDYLLTNTNCPSDNQMYEDQVNEEKTLIVHSFDGLVIITHPVTN